LRAVTMAQVQVGAYVEVHYPQMAPHKPIWEVIRVDRKTVVVKTGKGAKRVNAGHILAVMSAEDGCRRLAERMAELEAEIARCEALSANSIDLEKETAKRSAAYLRKVRRQCLRLEIHKEGVKPTGAD
jgi:uncharacterized small protein (DUF1192 family)